MLSRKNELAAAKALLRLVKTRLKGYKRSLEEDSAQVQDWDSKLEGAIRRNAGANEIFDAELMGLGYRFMVEEKTSVKVFDLAYKSKDRMKPTSWQRLEAVLTHVVALLERAVFERRKISIINAVQTVVSELRQGVTVADIKVPRVDEVLD